VPAAVTTSTRTIAGVALLVLVALAVSHYTGALDVRRSSSRSGPGAACAGPAASTIVRAYTLALTSPAMLGAFVQDNAASFAIGGDAVKCSALLSAALAANRELSQLDAIRDRAEAERDTGLDFNRAAYTADLAETLRELTGALPPLAGGDDGPYRGTKAYESAEAYSTLSRRAPGASARIDVLIAADAAVLRELAERLSDLSSP
jgi:hypothetical protein